MMSARLKFREGFGRHVCEHDMISARNGSWAALARIELDCDRHIDDDDTHNTDRNVTGCSSKQHRKLMQAREAWHNDEWFYAGVVVRVAKNDILLGEMSLWGIEANYPDSNNEYLLDAANEALQYAMEEAQVNLRKLVEA
jgi:hypothetical protein